MSAEQFARARDIFLKSLNQPEGERARFVAEQCSGNSSLHREVENLLAAHLPSVVNDAPEATPRHKSFPEGRAGAAHLDAKPESDRSSRSGDARNFPPGTLIAERYRIVSRLGAGGMGEVFRADDLTLDQPVALKFLPRGFARSPAWIARLRQEARLARTVTHANVCRVHDLVEWNGEYLLTMEYVDGEDLASLYRRIGRLPVERALDVARQVSLGLAVAHHKNVLHRDLKPANIMIDGLGQVRITDFGVAALAHEIPDCDIRTGTAACMAPEQITGRGVSVKSDVYSLGLVMFELFTGRQAFQAETTEEYAELHVNAAPPVPSQIVQDIPPEVERIILQCLKKDPAERPSSALVVAAALPGSNVLSAVVAAQLTPPPEIVALAQASKPRIPAVVMVMLVGILIAGAWLFRSSLTTGWDHLGPLPPGSLKERAGATLDQLEDHQLRPYYAHGYCDSHDVEILVSKYAPPSTNVLSSGEESGKPVFWYRESPEPMAAAGADNILFGSGRATLTDPPLDSGSRTIVFNSDGKLIAFIALPAFQTGSIAEQNAAASFDPLLRAAGLSGAAQSREPWGSEHVGDKSVYSWRESTTDGHNRLGRAIGLALNNQPVLFAITPAEEPPESRPIGFTFYQRKDLVGGGLHALFLMVIAVALPWAWRGYWSGRIDRDGAIRLALVVFLFDFLPSLLTVGHAESLAGELLRLTIAISRAMSMATAVAVLFVVVDLNTRRYWPEILVTWNRVVRSQFRDTGVREHVVTGVLVGCLWVFLAAGERALVQQLGWTVHPSLIGDRAAMKLYGLRDALASYVTNIPQAITNGLLFLLLLILMRMLTRNAKLAIALTALLLLPAIVPRGAHALTSWLFLGVGGIGVFLAVLTRVGLLAAVIAFFVTSVLNTTPLAPSFHAWYMDLSLMGVVLVIVVALYGAMGAKTRVAKISS